MGPRDPRDGLTPAPFEAQALGSLGPGMVAPGIFFCQPPISQDLEYHRFADDRTTGGVPNSPKVASNISFLFVGSLGLGLPVRPGAGGTSGSVLNRAERGPLVALFQPSEFNSPGRVTGDALERA